MEKRERMDNHREVKNRDKELRRLQMERPGLRKWSRWFALYRFQLRRVRKFFRPPEMNMDLASFSLEQEFSANRDSDLFLSRYRYAELKDMLVQSGILDHMRKQGLQDLIVRMDVRTYNDHRLYIYWQEEIAEKLALHLRVRLEQFSERKEDICGAEGCHFLVVDWLRLQNPGRKFRKDFEPFPGQFYPGLGMMSELSVFFNLLANDLNLSGIYQIPEFFHDAMLFARKYRFFDPDSEGKFRALRRDLRYLGLRRISQFIVEKKILHKESGKSAEWDMGKQLEAIKEPFLTYLKSSHYRHKMEESLKKNHYHIAC